MMDDRSEKMLKGVHPDLIRVVRKAYDNATPTFIITCGTRTMAEQIRLKAAGATRTLNSRHIPASNGFGHAIDFAVVVDGKVRWDWPLYANCAKVFKKAAADLKIPIEWGGDWRTFKDGPHIQLPFNKYPK